MQRGEIIIQDARKRTVGYYSATYYFAVYRTVVIAHDEHFYHVFKRLLSFFSHIYAVRRHASAVGLYAMALYLSLSVYKSEFYRSG